jgi:signal transduction histidine kinase
VASTPDGSVWLVSYTDNTVQRFRQGRISTSKLPPYSRSDTTRILSLYADGNSGVWLGGSFGLAKGVEGNVSFIKVPDIEKGAMVHAIARDARGSLWITVWGGNRGGGVLRLRDGNWTDFRHRVRLPQYRCRVLYADPLGRLWLGFEDGEVAVHEDEEFHVYSSRDGLPGGRVLAITRDREGNFWIGSEGGLSHFDHGHFVTLTKTNGLPGNSVSGIVEDDQGFLWLAGALAILRVGSQELEKALLSPSYRMQGESFDATDGLRGLPRQREPFPTAIRSTDGRLWFSTSEGVAVIDPRHLPRNIVPPPVTLEALKADDRTLTPSSGLRLGPGTRNLQFEYAALSLTGPEHIQFRYKLEGYDDDWRGPVSAREVTYTNLPPRNYRFRVIACNSDGVWNNTGAILDFSVAPAWYQTNWFLALSVIIGLFFLWVLYQLRLRQLAHQFNMGLEARVNERTRIARELHDTLIQSFHGLLLRFQAASNLLPTRPDEAKHRLENAIDKAAQAITEGRDAVHELRSSAEVTQDLPVAISALGQELAADRVGQDLPDYRVQVEGTARNLDSILRDEVYRIAAEAMRNAFRHAEARRIEVEIHYDERQLRVRVRDDGKGIDPKFLGEQERTGHWGLNGMRERAKAVGGNLAVWSEVDSGSEIEVTIPASIAYAKSGTHRSWWSGKLFRSREIKP